MKKMVQKGIVLLSGIVIGGSLLISENISAAVYMNQPEWKTEGQKTEKRETVVEGVLPVKILRDDGIEITPKEKEVINTSMKLMFTGAREAGDEILSHETGDTAYEDWDGLVTVRTELQYAVSRDRGETLQDWQSMDGESLCLDPGLFEDGQYCVRFRETKEYVLDEKKAGELRLTYSTEDGEKPTEKVTEAEVKEAPEDTVNKEGAEEAKETEGIQGDETGLGAEAETAEETKEPAEESEPEQTDSGETEEGTGEGAEAEGKAKEADKEEKAEKKTEENEEENTGENTEEDMEEDGRDEPAEKQPDAEARIRYAEELIMEEGIHVLESQVYYVHLDTTGPALFLDSDIEDGEWTNRGVKCCVGINDTGSRPAWLRITYEDNRVAEESFNQDTALSGIQKEFFINTESSAEDGGELVIEAADKAGNRTRITRRMGIDRTSPEITIKGAEEGRIYSKRVEISVAGEDRFPDSVCVGYTVKRISMGSEETVESSAMTLAECREGILFTAAADGDYVIECHARDRAGNTSRPVKRSFRIDTTSPGLKLEGITDGSVLRSDAALKITACDNYVDGYSVSIKGTVRSGSGSRELKLADYKTDGLISANTYYFKTEGDYDLNVSVTDAAGNHSEDSLVFSIDKEAPEITLLDGLNISDGLVTNEPPTVRFRVKESNYKNTLVSYELRPAADSKKKKKPAVKSSEWFMSNASDEYTVKIDEEGSYELVINAADAAGNTSGKTIRFTLDMTGPQIDYVENLNKKYIKSFKLPENFNEYIKDQGEVSYKTYINSRNYDESEQIEEDGKYVLKVAAIDDAGNQTEKTVEFIVDGTLPRVVIDGMADDGSVNRDGVIVLSLYDDGDYFKSVKLNGEEMVTENGQETVEITIPDYGDYTIEVEAADMADNILTQTIEAKCANSSPVEKGVSTVRTLKQSDKSGNNKGLRIFLIVMTVLVLAGSIVVFTLYNIKTGVN